MINGQELLTESNYKTLTRETDNIIEVYVDSVNKPRTVLQD